MSAALRIGIVIEIIDDNDFSRARKGDRRPACGKIIIRGAPAGIGGLGKGAMRIVEVEMHNWMKAWWTAGPRGSSYDWEGAECYNFKPDSHALFSASLSLFLLSSDFSASFVRIFGEGGGERGCHLFILSSPFHLAVFLFSS